MKVSYFLIALSLLWSCASSQKNQYWKEAQKKVLKLKPLIELTDDQASKMTEIESTFLKNSKSLEYSPSYHAQLAKISKIRNNKIRGLLQRDQYIKLDIIENNRIKPTPIRVQ